MFLDWNDSNRITVFPKTTPKTLRMLKIHPLLVAYLDIGLFGGILLVLILVPC